MGIHRKTTVCAICIALASSFTGGCGRPAETPLTTEIDLGTTIGSLTEIFAVQSIPVEGYGLVGGLRGTGSAECPPEIRAYLRQYILARLPESPVGVDELIDSRNTAVVRVHGMMPAAMTKNEPFDVRVDGLAGTQTTSLKGGSLYGTDLKEEGSFGIATRILATAEGPVFIDTIGPNAADKQVRYVLGGGRVRDEYKIRLALRQPDYLIARRISNLLDARFGSGTAKAVQPDLITLRVPAKYGGQKQRFVSIVSATYVTETPEVVEERINTFVRTLATSQDREASEIALEAIGNRCVKKLAILLNSADGQVRLRAARCMLNLGSDQGLQTLREIATNTRSVYRIEALEAITAAVNRNDAAAIGRRLLRDEVLDVRLAAYEQLRKLDDIAITRDFIAGSFYLEQIAQAKRKEIFASRSGQPRIVLFGAPIYAQDNIFVQSADGDITINAASGQKHVSLIRKVPNLPGVMELKSSFELSDIIRTLCEEPVLKKGSVLRAGLNVSYADAIALLKQMCEQGAVDAEFHAGPLPRIE